jgi:hypothetical protein
MLNEVNVVEGIVKFDMWWHEPTLRSGYNEVNEILTCSNEVTVVMSNEVNVAVSKKSYLAGAKRSKRGVFICTTVLVRMILPKVIKLEGLS